jgi:general secretion pathway protein K
MAGLTYIITQQKGFALITALLIVALATVISVNIATHLQLDVRRTGNILASEQALQYVIAAENLLGIALYEDHKNNKIDYYGDPYDHFDAESWADIYEFPFENALIRSQATDLQGCFNLNSLVVGGAINTVAQDRFRRLLSSVSTASKLSLSGDLSQAIIDWIDKNNLDEIPDGAEDGHYINLESPYRTANAPLQSVSELRLIKGFEDRKTYDAIAPLVCAFGIPASINVNTASEEVLNSLAPGVDGADIVERRANDPFDDINEFLDYKGLRTTITAPSGFSVSSEYFLLKTEIKLGQSRTLMYSIIFRDNTGKTRVLARSQGAY